jgi:hypothetical protein
MKKIGFVCLIIVAALNIVLAFAGNKLLFVPAALFLFAAFAIYKSDKPKV